MDHFFSQKTGGFYNSSLHTGMMPDDAVKITEEQHQQLLDGNADGKVIRVVDGKVGLYQPESTANWDSVRTRRDALLAACDWTVSVPDNNLSDDQRGAWLKYRQALRDITTKYKTPDAVVWPQEPK